MIRPSATHINDEKESDGTEEQRKVKLIVDLTKRGRRAKRKYWREDNRKRAERVAITAQVEANEATALNATPPITPPYHLAINQNAGIQQAPCGRVDRGSACLVRPIFCVQCDYESMITVTRMIIVVWCI